DYLLTGHWHSNRLIEHGDLEEVNTETFVNGGIDITPAGYRVVSFDGTRLRYAHHTIVDDPVLELIWPAARAACVPPGMLDVIVAVESGATTGAVAVSLDGGTAIPAVDMGGWDRVARVEVTAGQHSVAIVGPSGMMTARHFCAAPPGPAPAITDWT